MSTARAARACVALLLLLSALAGSAPQAAAGVLSHAGGAIVLTFDDGCASSMLAATEMEARGQRGTFFIIAESAPPDASCQQFLSPAQVAQLSARGHDIESHTMTHPHLDALPDAAVHQQLVDSRARLEALIGKPVKHFAYPYGEATPRVQAAAASVYSSARWYYRDVPSMPLGTTNTYAVPAVGIENGTTLAQAQAYVDMAATQGITVVLAFHDITAAPSTFDITPKMFTDVLDYVLAKHVPVITYAQAMPDVQLLDKGGNEWWVQANLLGPDASNVAKVESFDDGGSLVTLAKRSWGDYAGSYHVEPGHLVTYVVTLTDGRQWQSCAFTHPGGVCSGAAPVSAPTNDSAFQATFTGLRGNAWWVEVNVRVTGASLAAVDARVQGGPWAALTRTTWGSWATSIQAANGSHVEFRARSSSGAASVSAPYAWPPR